MDDHMRILKFRLGETSVDQIPEYMWKAFLAGSVVERVIPARQRVTVML